MTPHQRVTGNLATQEDHTVIRQTIARLLLALRLVVLLVDLSGPFWRVHLSWCDESTRPMSGETSS